MTTTAEKIKVMQAYEDGATIEWKQKQYTKWLEFSKQNAAEEVEFNFEHYEYRIKPPDPEPLECWAWFKPSNPNAATYLHLNKDDATAHKDFMTMEGWTLYNLRQVTPQMLENEKDAARYRKHKELAGTYPWACCVQVEDWDERLDEFLEEER